MVGQPLLPPRQRSARRHTVRLGQRHMPVAPRQPTPCRVRASTRVTTPGPRSCCAAIIALQPSHVSDSAPPENIERANRDDVRIATTASSSSGGTASTSAHCATPKYSASRGRACPNTTAGPAATRWCPRRHRVRRTAAARRCRPSRDSSRSPPGSRRRRTSAHTATATAATPVHTTQRQHRRVPTTVRHDPVGVQHHAVTHHHVQVRVNRDLRGARRRPPSNRCSSGVRRIVVLPPGWRHDDGRIMPEPTRHTTGKRDTRHRRPTTLRIV